MRSSATSSSGLLGRAALLESLERQLAEGLTILLHGPVGVGKTALLLDLRHRALASGCPCGYAPRTEHLSDVTQALLRAYHATGAQGRQRHVRGLLRLAVERQRGTLLLDGVRAAGTALKGFLRSLRGTGLGIVLAADAEHGRDHARVRALRLAYLEIAVPPLERTEMRLLLSRLLEDARLPQLPADEDRGLLLEIAAGRPGILTVLVQALRDSRYWRDGRIRGERLRTESLVAVARRYLQPGEPGRAGGVGEG